MKLTIVLPDRIIVEKEVSAVKAESPNGSFGLLKRHIDVVSPLSAGILEYRDDSGQEWFVAHDDGVLVKQGREVLVSVRRAIQDRRLGRLKETLRNEMLALDDQQKKSRSILSLLEGNILRQVNEQTKRDVT
jgi:F-type H+-transporting ATPase subunit epsilon